MKSNFLISVVLVVVILAATILVNENRNLKDLGYPDDEIRLINDSRHADIIVANGITYDLLLNLKEQIYYNEEYLEQYCSLLNRVYTEDSLEILTTGIKAYVDKYGVCDTLAFTKDDRVVESIEAALKPSIFVSRKLFPPTGLNEGSDAIRPYIRAESYFDGNIANEVEIDGFIDTSREGSYMLSFYASDSRGYSEGLDVEIIVRILDTRELDNPE
ncbi:hypothetical protein SAMN02745751_00623 [Dethiosulfatibacter aminovorans DSM 17477]|uniref:Pesticidal crystal protein Cry22Aa Ig-like domain-containing protein n=1 Tax=Dethiosulfatibacter aminovorans DSM 17477 TaxID=1121476 RepID=A0A1M6C8S4_9FIRM|nr:hypothetical protein [Dethiosulfatibacter aminovorans]SHI57366.1 hypothetical protein SAMN02745751_00623 [Dethiosulfatibacter aminovorans DSM 17477]